MANSVLHIKNSTISRMLLITFLAFTFIIVNGTPIDTIKKVNGNITEIYNFPEAIYGLTVDKDGILYFADTYSKIDHVSRVYTLSPPYTGTPIETEIESKSIAGLMWHKNHLYVAFLGKNEVVVYNKDLEFEMSYEIESPWSFTTDGKEVFVINYFGTVSHLPKRGRITDFIEDLNNPFAIQYNGDNAFWISEHDEDKENGIVMLYDYQAEVIDTVNYSFQNPSGLAMDQSGYLYVADAEAGKIIKVSPSGKVSLVTEQYQKPLCLTVRHDNTIIINSNDNDGMLLLIKNKR